MKRSHLTVILFLAYAVICCWLSFISGSLSFIASSFIYLVIIYVASFTGEEDTHIQFIQLCLSFLLVYSLYSMITHFVFISNAYNDYYVNIDSTKFLNRSLTIAQLKYVDIWQTAFTEFPYLDSSLFYAWTGTLQKIANLDPFYSLLFQKFNVSFLGSFIPSIVYLLCYRITDQQSAFKAAVAYGLFSFTFYFSVSFLRDIHIALIYAIGLYIITCNKYSLKNYIILALLGICAYFIRIENGLFFLSFLVVWMFKSSSKNKWLISFLSVIAIIGILVTLGGIGGIYQRALSTIQIYSEKQALKSDPGALSQALNNLPIPLNYLGATGFGQIRPFPFWAAVKEDISLVKKLFYLPYYLAPLFWILVWTRIILNFRISIYFFKRNKLVVLLTLSYLLLVSLAQPLERRLMAVYPIIFMVYSFISPKMFKNKELLFGLLMYIGLIVIYIILKF